MSNTYKDSYQLFATNSLSPLLLLDHRQCHIEEKGIISTHNRQVEVPSIHSEEAPKHTLRISHNRISLHCPRPHSSTELCRVKSVA